ncbi:MAG: hypothetical protein JXB43_07845 [Dehalococcoidia bacterium]|nr:hypothetical protein [Dehalococcoidia bacterium]
MWFTRKQILCTNCGFLSWEFYIPEDGTRTKIIECSSSWRNRIQTNKDLGSLEDSETGEGINIFCIRGQWVFSPTIKSQEINYIDVERLVQPRDCIFYIKYEPGFSPEEHKELKREAETRRTIIISSLFSGIIGAMIGAAAAIIVQLASR